MHGVGTGSKRLALLSPVGRGACLFAVHDIGGYCECRKRMLCVSVSRSLAKLGYCVLKQCFCDIVNTVVVVSVLREITCRLKIDYISVLVTYGLNVCVLDSRKRVCGNRESRYAECHKAVHIGIVKCHLDFLIRILIVHKMDYIHSIDIKPAKPFKVSLVSLNHLVVIKPVALNRVSLRAYFFAVNIVVSAV